MNIRAFGDCKESSLLTAFSFPGVLIVFAAFYIMFAQILYWIIRNDWAETK